MGQPPIGADNGFAKHCDECGTRGMKSNRSLKAVAKERLKDIYAIIRDAVPCAAQVATGEENLVGKECTVHPDAPYRESEGHQVDKTIGTSSNDCLI